MAKAGRKATAVLVTVIALAAAANTSAHDDPIAAADQPGPTIVLHVANYAALPREVLDAAKARVAGVYEVIGVRTVWDDRGEAVRRLQNGELHVTVLLLPRDMTEKKNSADGTKRDLLGQAHMPSGRAYIFYDRIAAMPGPPASLAEQLGDVIAHEVGHLVLRAPRHSPSGIMRASLGVRANYLQSFNTTEARTIRAALMPKK